MSDKKAISILPGLKNYVFLNPFAMDMVPLRSAVNFNVPDTSDDDDCEYITVYRRESLDRPVHCDTD